MKYYSPMLDILPQLALQRGDEMKLTVRSMKASAMTEEYIPLSDSTKLYSGDQVILGLFPNQYRVCITKAL